MIEATTVRAADAISCPAIPCATSATAICCGCCPATAAVRAGRRFRRADHRRSASKLVMAQTALDETDAGSWKLWRDARQGARLVLAHQVDVTDRAHTDHVGEAGTGARMLAHTRPRRGSWRTISPIWPMPVGPIGWPMAIRPPDGLTAQRPPMSRRRSFSRCTPCPSGHRPIFCDVVQLLDREGVMQLDDVEIFGGHLRLREREPGGLLGQHGIEALTGLVDPLAARRRTRDTIARPASMPSRRMPSSDATITAAAPSPTACIAAPSAMPATSCRPAPRPASAPSGAGRSGSSRRCGGS